MSQTSNDAILQCFEWYLSDDGSFWKKAAALAPSFSSLGITMVWLPPATKGQAGIHDVGYGIYDLYDLVADVFGWFFVFAGLIGFCCFGVVRAGCNCAAPPAAPIVPEESSTMDSVDELKKYKELADSGAITQEEFEAKKEQLLN